METDPKLPERYRDELFYRFDYPDSDRWPDRVRRWEWLGCLR
jgi:hypothetical protein